MASAKKAKADSDVGPPPEMEVHQQPSEPLVVEPLPPATGGIIAAHETLKRLAEILQKEDEQLQHHIHTLRVIFADGSSQLVEGTEDGKVHIIEQRNLQNAVSPVNGADVMTVAQYAESVKSSKALWEAEQRAARSTDHNVSPPIVSPPSAASIGERRLGDLTNERTRHPRDERQLHTNVQEALEKEEKAERKRKQEEHAEAEKQKRDAR